MENIVYTNIPAILQSCESLEAEITMLNRILAGMRTAMYTASLTGQFEEYKLDTGQTRNEVTYRSINDLTLAYTKLIGLKKMLYNDLNNNQLGRIIRLVSNNNYNGNY